jgi:hypothetical protein
MFFDPGARDALLPEVVQRGERAGGWEREGLGILRLESVAIAAA